MTFFDNQVTTQLNMKNSSNKALFSPGRVINNRYEVVEVMRLTRMSQTFRCVDGITKNEVFLKLSNNDLNEVSREGDILEMLDHPNVIKLLDRFIVDGAECLVFPFAPDGDLQSLVRRYPYGLYDEKFVKHIIIQMLSAVAYIHSRGVIHRDIKLENFLIFHDNSSEILIALTDFGISQFADQVIPSVSGTIAYFAPEIFTDHVSTTKSDMWALGVTFYTLLSGLRPFSINGPQKKTYLKFRRAITEGNFIFPKKRWDDMKDAEEFVRKFLVADPSQRIDATCALADTWLNYPNDFPLPPLYSL